MAKNIYQVYQTNPIASNQSTDLMYFGRSPYGLGDDTAMLFSDFAIQFGAPYVPAALTRTDDTNVTMTLGGTPNTALLQPVSLTLGWTGQLSPARGGTGVNNGTNTLTLAGNLATSGAFNSTFTMTGATNVTFPTSGTLATTSQLPTPSALTRTDDTNVTITLGGTPNTALLQAVSLTMGWSGQLSPARGGTGVNNGTSTFTIGGNFQMTGAFTFNGTLTGNTSVTFPTSGTLATTTSASGHVTSGTINQLAWYAATGDTVSGLSTVNSAGLLTNGSGVPAWVAYTGTGAPVLATSPSITTPRIAQINDANGNAILQLNAVASSVNNLVMANSVTTGNPELAAAGTDTNIGITYRTKATGAHQFISLNTTIPMVWNTGTTAQHTTNWAVPNTAASRTITLQDADGTLAYLSDITSSSVPTGAVFYFPVASNPTGYLACTGTAVSRTTYAALFALIGTTYGAGDGSTTFNLPNLSRRVVMGEGGTGTGIIGNGVSNTGGSETINILFTNLPTSIPAGNGVITTQSVASGVNTLCPGGAGTWTTGSAVATSVVQSAMILRPLIKT